MAQTMQELMVKVSPEGIKETSRELRKQREEFTEMADTAEDSTAKMERFSARWAGAMKTFTAGLAVATAGLASKIPIIGELLDGMGAVLDALAFKLDGALRPALNDVRNALFETANSITDAEGALGGLREAFTGLMEALSQLQQAFFETFTGRDLDENPLLEFWFKLASLNVGGLAADAVNALQTILDEGFSGFGENMAEEFGFKEHIENLDDVGADILDSIKSGFTGAVGGVTEWGKDIVSNVADGITSKMNSAAEAAGSIAEWIETKIGDAVDAALEWGKSIPSDIATGIRNKIQDVQKWAGNVADDIAENIPSLDEAIEWGKDLIQGIIEGLQKKSTELGNAVEEHASQVVRDRLPGSDAETGPLSDLSTTGPALVETFAGGMEQSASRAGDAASTVAEAADPRAGGGFAARRRTQPTIVMDGRTLTEQDGRYRRDQTARRGRDG